VLSQLLSACCVLGVRCRFCVNKGNRSDPSVPGSAVVASGAVAAMASGSAVTETSGVTAVTSGSAAMVTFESEVVLVTPSPEDVARHRVPPPDSSRTPPVHPPHEGIRTSSQEGGERPPRSSKHIRI
jgi:hypothetical protein